MGLFRRNKNTNKPVIRQILDLLPRWIFDNCTNTNKTDKGCSTYKTYDQFVALTYGQLYKCHTLSDISTGIGVSETFISDLGLKQSPARSTMSDGNKKRNWQIFESLYYNSFRCCETVLRLNGRLLEISPEMQVFASVRYLSMASLAGCEIAFAKRANF